MPAGDRRVAVAEITVRDRTKAGIASSVGNFQTLHKVVRDNWWGIQNLGNAFSGIGAIITGGMASAAKAAIEFETGIAGVARTTRQQGESAAEAIKNTQGLAQELRNIAKNAPVAVSRLADIAQEAGALGIARSDIAAFTSTIVKLVATTNLTDDMAVKLARVSGVMGITADQFDALGSTILYMGRSTQATESEIVQFALDLAPVVKAAHGTTSELVALSAVLPSLGQKSGRTYNSIQRTVSDLGDAFRGGGDDAKNFATIMGVSAEKAAKITSKDGIQGLLLFVEGLHKADKAGVDLDGVLGKLGIEEQRQRTVLKAMAAGVDSVTNANLDLRTAFANAARAERENTELTEAYNAINNTTAAQLEILRNKVHDAGITFGDALLPVLKLVVEGLGFLVDGFAGLSGPVKTFYAAIFLTVGAFAALIGIVALIGPKLVLVKGAMLEVRAAYTAFAGSAANAAAILATANNSTQASTLKAAFAFGRLSAAEREAAYAAFQEANAVKIGNAIHEQAIVLNDDLAYSSYLVKHANDLETLSRAESVKVAQLQVQYDAAVAAGKTRTAQAIARKVAIHEEEAAASLAASRAALAENAALGKTIAARRAAINAIIAQMEAEIAETAAATRSATAMALLGRASALLKRSLGPILLLLTLLAPLLMAHGAAQESSAEAAAKNARYQAGVAKALEQQRAGSKTAVRDYILQALGASGAAAAAARYGITLLQLQAIIMGTAPPDQVTAAHNKLAQAYKNGDKAAADANNVISQLRTSFSNQGAAAANSANGNNASTNALGKNEDAAKRAKKALDDLRETNEQINQALLALPQALLAQRDAAFAVLDATDEYNKAMEDLANHDERVAAAEREVAEARIDAKQAIIDIKKAEVNLSRARQQAADDVADAQDKYLDAQDKVKEANDKVLDAEAALAKLREGPSLADITKATNKLVEANLKLRASQFKVRDAQYMLNYLQSEGASSRDLEEAQFNLDEANHELAESTVDVADATQELADVQTIDPKEIADAERDLASARRDAEGAVRDQRDAEQDLADARTAQANDSAYLQAQEDLLKAQQDGADAAEALKDAQAHLKDEQKDVTATRNAAKAQLALEEALYHQAEANVEVQKQLALSRGEEFGTGREARALAAELAKLGLAASGPIATDFRKFRSILGGAKKDIAEANDELDNFGDGFDIGNVTGALDGLSGDDGFPPIFEDAAKSSWDRFTGWLKDNWKGALIGALVGIAIVIALAIFAPEALIAGATAAIIAASAALGAWIWSHKGDMWGAMKKAFNAVIHFDEWIRQKIIDAISYLGSKIADFGSWIAHGIINSFKKNWIFGSTMGEWIWGKIVESWNWIKDKVTDFGEWLGGRVVAGIKTGLGWFSSFGSYIWGRLVDGYNWVKDRVSDLGGWIADRIRNGVTGGLSGLGRAAGNVLKTALTTAVGYAIAPINVLIKIFNGVLEKIGNIHFSTPGIPILHVPSVEVGFGFVKNFEIDPIKLAEGGIVRKPTLGIFGEAGDEAVLPLDALYEMLAPLDAIANQLLAQNDRVTAGNSVYNNSGDTFNIYADDADALEIAEEVIWKKLVRT